MPPKQCRSWVIKSKEWWKARNGQRPFVTPLSVICKPPHYPTPPTFGFGDKQCRILWNMFGTNYYYYFFSPVLLFLMTNKTVVLPAVRQLSLHVLRCTAHFNLGSRPPARQFTTGSWSALIAPDANWTAETVPRIASLLWGFLPSEFKNKRQKWFSNFHKTSGSSCPESTSIINTRRLAEGGFFFFWLSGLSTLPQLNMKRDVNFACRNMTFELEHAAH